MHRPWIRVLAAWLVFAQLSCATGSLTPLPQSMPAARASLLPEYRIFYDTLQDYGDWTLIEPYGYVFRPRATIANFQPYSEGFWVPTDNYGWVWLSSEPYGWATYHYGKWFYDSYQGWVWVPGLEWAPAWVDWQTTDSYVGWAPMTPRGAPAWSNYHFVPASQLGSTNLQQYAQSAEQLGAAVTQAKRVSNLDEQQGVTFNRGPSMEWVERRTGPLTRARIEDLVTGAPLRPGTSIMPSADTPPPGKPSPLSADSVATVQHAAERAASEARTMIRTDGKLPARMKMVRPLGVPQVKPAAPASPARSKRKPPTGSAAPDTTR